MSSNSELEGRPNASSKSEDGHNTANSLITAWLQWGPIVCKARGKVFGGPCVVNKRAVSQKDDSPSGIKVNEWTNTLIAFDGINGKIPPRMHGHLP